MTDTNTTAYRGRYDRWRAETYPRFAPALATLTLVIASIASIGVFILTRVQGAEQERRATAISDLQKCFDTYASRSASTSKAVRDASSEVSDATTARDVALDALFRYIATDPAEDTPRGVRLFAKLLATNADLVSSQANLAQVRADNPVPDPPSSFCDVKP